MNKFASLLQKIYRNIIVSKIYNYAKNICTIPIDEEKTKDPHCTEYARQQYIYQRAHIGYWIRVNHWKSIKNTEQEIFIRKTIGVFVLSRDVCQPEISLLGLIMAQCWQGKIAIIVSSGMWRVLIAIKEYVFVFIELVFYRA